MIKALVCLTMMIKLHLVLPGKNEECFKLNDLYELKIEEAFQDQNKRREEDDQQRSISNDVHSNYKVIFLKIIQLGLKFLGCIHLLNT